MILIVPSTYLLSSPDVGVELLFDDKLGVGGSAGVNGTESVKKCVGVCFSCFYLLSVRF